MNWSNSIARVVAALAWTSFSFGLAVEPALAHGGAALTVSPAEVAPGDKITVTGEGVESGEQFTITLEGVLYQAALGMVTVGDDEDFHQTFAVPVDAPPGPYQVRATSAEGEVIAAELSILPSAAPEGSRPPVEPSAAPMQLYRGKPPAEVAITLIGIFVSAGLGFMLVRQKDSGSSAPPTGG